MSPSAAFVTGVSLLTHAGRTHADLCSYRGLTSAAPLFGQARRTKRVTIEDSPNCIIMIASDPQLTSQKTLFEQPSVAGNGIGAPVLQEIDSVPASKLVGDKKLDQHRHDVVANYERFLNSPEANDVDVCRPVFISDSGALVCSYP